MDDDEKMRQAAQRVAADAPPLPQQAQDVLVKARESLRFERRTERAS